MPTPTGPGPGPVLDPTTRSPSTPATGAARYVTNYLLGLFATFLVGKLDPAIAEQVNTAAATLLNLGVATGLTYLGKWGRDKGYGWAVFF